LSRRPPSQMLPCRRKTSTPETVAACKKTLSRFGSSCNLAVRPKTAEEATSVRLSPAGFQCLDSPTPPTTASASFTQSLDPPAPAQPKLIAIPWSDLVIEGDVASGAFGAVSKGSYNRVPVAVKRLHPRGNKQELLEEVETMRRMRHPNLLAMMGLTANPADQTLGVVMEFLPASLHSVLHSRKYHAAYGPCLTWQGCFLAVATDVAQGMHHLHLCGFVHRDLKPGNILLSEGWTAKVADFGEVQREANRAMGGTGGVAIQAPNSDGVNAAPTAASLAAAAAVAPKQRRLSLRARANQALKSPETPTNATSSATTTPATTAPNSAHSTVRNSPAESPANTMGHALQMLPSTPAASAACVGQPAAERRIHGTPPYISPEGASAGTALPLVVGPPTDVWSFGCVLAHIAARSAPYTKTMVKPAEVVRALRDGSASPLADLTDVNIPAELRALAESCCQWSADARPTFGELCKRLSSAEMVQAVCGPSEEAEDDDEDGGEARRPAIRLKWYSEKRAPSEVKPKPGEPSAAQQAAAAAAEEEAKLLDC